MPKMTKDFIKLLKSYQAFHGQHLITYGKPHTLLDRDIQKRQTDSLRMFSDQ